MSSEAAPPHPSGEPRDTVPSHRMRALIGGLALLAVVTLIAGGLVLGGKLNAPAHLAPAATATATPSATPTPRTLYSADWSSGAGGWSFPTSWQAGGGHVHTDSDAEQRVALPYVPTASAYTLALDITVETVKIGQGRLPQFGIEADDANGNVLYSATVYCSPNQPHTAQSAACPGFDLVTVHQQQGNGASGSTDFTAGTSTRTYLFEVDGNSITFCPSDRCIASATSASPRPLAPAHIVLVTRDIQLDISRCVLTTP